MATPTLIQQDSVFILDFGDDENMTTDVWVTAMHGLLDQVDAAEGPKALVTTGSAKHYSNGLDTPFLATASSDETAAYVERVLTVVRRLMLLGAPTVAAINGHAFGMGAFLILAHDHAVMREDRGFVCFPEVHLGMSFPERLMEIARATLTPRALRQALTTGHRYSGPEAVALGMVDSTASLDELVASASAIAAPLAPTAGPNLALIKQQTYRTIAARVEET